MKHLFMVMVFMAITTFAIDTKADEPSVQLGYVNGVTGTTGYSSTANDADVCAAIFLTADVLSKYPGCEISGVRAQLYSRMNLESLELWVRESLDGENLASATITLDTDPAILKGWNEAKFTTPVTIPEKENLKGLYVGVTYHQAASARGIASLEQGLRNGGWLKAPGEEWKDMGYEYNFCIEAIVTGDALPLNNMRLESVEFAPYYVLDKGVYSFTATVRNIGIATVTGFDVTLKMEDAEPMVQHYDCEIAYNKTFSFDFKRDVQISAADGDRTVELTIDKVNGEPDFDPADNTVSGTYRIVPFDMRKRVLVEEFTTEGCGNCPRVAGWMHEVLKDEKYADIMIPLCHHSGYGTDWLTIDADREYVWFYNPSRVFAPAIMTDRLPVSAGVAPVNPTSANAIKQYVDDAAAEDAKVSLSLHSEIEGDVMHVTVRGIKVVDQLSDNPRIVCTVTEDNVPARNQSGGGANYIQQHVNRSVNATWGEPIPFVGDSYEYTVDLPLGDYLKKENLNLVAYIFNYDSNSRANCPVLNAALLPYSEMTVSSISMTTGDADNTPTQWFTIDGKRLQVRPTAPGIYIESTSTTSRKIVIR
ncbi:MAG: Omp28-related outer membrane protein [Prevotella sp.]|nr:Omp28-related outer membrane protein [Prevotella sp.]MCM1075242.1 Omp28-related outer membrane protein [Ruminococcus sp.]